MYLGGYRLRAGIGTKDLPGAYAGMQMLFAFLCAYLVYFFLAGGAGVGMAVLLAIGAYVLGRKLYKQTRRKKNAAEKGPRAAKRLKTSGRT